MRDEQTAKGLFPGDRMMNRQNTNSSSAEAIKGTILIVDDAPYNLYLLSAILKKYGYKVHSAASGSLAFAAIETAPPDIILLDITMPDMDGYEVCKQLKHNEQTRDIPVLFISGREEVDDKVRAFAVGGVDYITKPFQAEEVLARVTTHLTVRSMQKQLQEQNTRLHQEIHERHRAEEELRQIHADLEARVQERTAELVEANRSLLKEIEERNQVEQQLQGNLSFVETLLTTIPTPVFYTDTRGCYGGCNPHFAEQLLGLPRDQIAGRSFAELASAIPTDLVPSYHTNDEALLREPGVCSYEAPVLCANGTQCKFLFHKATFLDSAGSVAGVVGIMWDVTERVRHEREREAVITVASALRTVSSRNELIATLLEQVGQWLGAEGALLLSHDTLQNVALVEQGYGSWQHSYTQRFALSEQRSLIANIETWLADSTSLEHTSSPCLAYTPLIAEDQTIGTLVVGCQHTITSEDMRILNAIGDMAANALHRISLHEQTKRRLEHIQALHSIDQTITTSLNLRVTLNVLIFQVTTQLHIDAAAVLLFDHDTQRLDFAAGRGFRTSAIQKSSLYLGQGLAGRVATGHGFVHVPDLRQPDNAIVRRELMQQEEFVTYYGMPLIAKGRIKGVIELYHRSFLTPDQEWLDFLGTLAGQASIAIDNADMFTQLQKSNKELTIAYDATIEGWARALELRDAETEGHCRRVTDMTVRLAQRMSFREDEIVHIRRGAILHDIGKVAIPDSILLKQGPLTDAEYAIMQQHTTYAYSLLSPIPFLCQALDIPYCHHEKWDGSGYPRGLKTTDIPLSARIFAVVDVWDALRSDRPYRKGWSRARVREHIAAGSGSHFDPQVVEVFLAMVDEESSQQG